MTVKPVEKICENCMCWAATHGNSYGECDNYKSIRFEDKTFYDDTCDEFKEMQE